ncbi:MAG: type IV toxin-antitoxin system AbiEi family antitoxin domain-containing protein [Gordonia sp. (in: high G+C Gram-positive bacteria)]|uniref:type IV toxin-antitoxin system AbiEi family antitoxin domain-containing protein n=1 Tax=Gordonia sp. (in: high G+C Gram-positive bacteria) TaxID=84139 RepID=UPI0039E6D544
MSQPITDYPLDRHGLIRRDAVLRVGISDDQLAAAVRAGDLVRLTRGVFMAAQPPAVARTSEGRAERYRLTCIAGATSSRAGDAPLSHQSAAAVHGLPLLKPSYAAVHVIKHGRGGSSLKSGRYRHCGHLTDRDIVEIDGVRVTSLLRTAIDVACAGGFAQALTAVDGALRRGVTHSELDDAIRGQMTGVRIARRAVEHGDGLSASVGESWSRAQMIEAGLPSAVLQREYFLEGHQQSPDFDWDGRLVGEFDGHIKYKGVLRPGESPHEAVIREKEREDRFRRAGIQVVRWTWRVLENGGLIPLLHGWMTHAGVRTS